MVVNNAVRADGRLVIGVALAIAACTGGGDATAGIPDDTRPVDVRIESFERVLVADDSTVTITVATAGVYTIYYEFRSTLDVAAVDAPPEPPDDLELDVAGDGGDEVRIRTSRDRFEYEYEPYRGTSLGTVELPAAGSYSVTVSGVEEPFVLALGLGTLR